MSSPCTSVVWWPARPLLAAIALGSTQMAAWATAPEGAARGAALYLMLPAGQGSCVECHGPDPSLDRNRLLNAARGPSAISLAITKAAAMGWLGDVLDASMREDLSAHLALVNASLEPQAVAATWPWVMEFGRVAVGGAHAVQLAHLRNLGPLPLPVAPTLALDAHAAGVLDLQHDCPPELPPQGTCSATVRLFALAPGLVSGALLWDGRAGVGRACQPSASPPG